MSKRPLGSTPAVEIIVDDEIEQENEAPANDDRTHIGKETVLRGGSAKGPLVLETTPGDDGHDYVKLSHSAAWLTEYTFGVSPARRPLARSVLIDLCRAAYREAALRKHLGGRQSSAVASLGLDAPRATSCVEHARVSRKQLKRNHAVFGDILEVCAPGISGCVAARNLNMFATSQPKWEIFIQLTEDNLAWVRDYLRAELVRADTSAGPPSPATEGVEVETPEGFRTPKKGAFWCRAASEWRIRYRTSDGTMRVKRQFVPRRPADDFKERSREAREKLEQFFSENHCELASQ